MNLENYLKKRDIKITKARVNTLQIFFNSEQSLSADDLYKEFKEKKLKVDLSTIYRTLEIFEKEDIITKFDLGNGKYNYILKNRGHKHTIQCKLCHKEVEYDCPMPQIQELLKRETGFLITEGELSVKGICDQCKEK